MKKFVFYFSLLLFIFSCKDETLPKPKAFLALEFPEAIYTPANLSCPYEFEINEISRVLNAKGSENCWININYPLLNATLFITYQDVRNNLDSLLRDAQKLPLQHTIKADFIAGDVYQNPDHRTFGMLYEIEGNAASQAQFYLTDSTSHFITGSLYFNQKPNFDSIMPAAAYLKKDIKHIMETLRWK